MNAAPKWAILLATSLLILCRHCVRAQTFEKMKSVVDAEMPVLTRLLAEDPAGVSALAHLAVSGSAMTREMHALYFPYQQMKDGTVIERTVDSAAVTASIEEALYQHQSTLTRLIEVSQTQQGMRNVRPLIEWTKPTPEIKAALEGLVFNEASHPVTVADGYQALYDLGLADDRTTQSLMQTITHLRDAKYPRSNLAADLLGRAARWGQVEKMLPLYRSMLEMPYQHKVSPGGDPEHPRTGSDPFLLEDYGFATVGLGYLGSYGAECIPLLKARLAELKAAREKSGTESSELEKSQIESLETCLKQLEGKAWPTLYRNQKGQFLGIGKAVYEEYKARNGEAGAATVKTIPNSADPSGISRAPRSNPNGAAPADSMAWWWYVCAGLALAGLALWIRKLRQP